MEEIAIRNLQVLIHPSKLAANKFTLQNNEMITNEDDSFDTIYTLQELEYPVYFTFHQLMNHVHTSYRNDLHGYTRKDIIDMMEDALDNLCELYERSEAKRLQFGVMLDDLDDKVFYIKQYYRYGMCSWFPTIIKEWIHTSCMFAIQCSKEIIKDYMEMNPILVSDDEEDEGEEEEDEDEEEEDEDEEKEATEESEDISDLDETNHTKVD